MSDRCTRTDYSNGSYCVDCTELPGVPGSPAHLDTITVRAWNAGANLVHRESGPCVLSWSPTAGEEGVFVGLYPDGLARDVTNPTTLAVAWYVYAIGVSLLAVPYAVGVPIAASAGVTTSSVLAIEHVGAQATFKIGSTVVVTAPIFAGPTRAGACLYASGDSVP